MSAFNARQIQTLETMNRKLKYNCESIKTHSWLLLVAVLAWLKAICYKAIDITIIKVSFVPACISSS